MTINKLLTPDIAPTFIQIEYADNQFIGADSSKTKTVCQHDYVCRKCGAIAVTGAEGVCESNAGCLPAQARRVKLMSKLRKFLGV